MSDDIGHKLSSLWTGFRKKAADTVTGQEAGFVRGKIAGKPVLDDAGVLIVDAGHLIDDVVIARATAAGRMHALVSAAVTAQAQDMKEKAQQAYGDTPEGIEAHSMASSEQYIEARGYIRRTAGVDVTDSRGSVIVPAGTQIEDEDVRAARDAGQLSALIFAAQQPLPPDFTPAAARQPGQSDVPSHVSRRTAVPLGESYASPHSRAPVGDVTTKE